MTGAACDVEPEEPEETTAEDAEVDTTHLDDVEDGCGCAEVWEHLSEQRGE